MIDLCLCFFLLWRKALSVTIGVIRQSSGGIVGLLEHLEKLILRVVVMTKVLSTEAHGLAGNQFDLGIIEVNSHNEVLAALWKLMLA
nr:hypothetical protein Iba_chr14dCG14150 [Ipomoea batatas]